MQQEAEIPSWYVLRDLKRANAKAPAYKTLPEMGFEVFTPMHWVLKSGSKRGTAREYVPLIHGLLFAKSIKSELEAVIAKSETLQFCYVKGAHRTPMVVPTNEMERFIRAVTAAHADCIYYSPDDITPDMIGRKVRIVGGTMDGMTGNLVKRRGSKKKRLILQIKGLLAASVEITDAYIEFL